MRHEMTLRIDHQHQAARLNIVVCGVMQDVTMQHPLTSFCGDELDIIAFAGRDTDCVLGQLRSFRHRMPIGGDNFEGHPMQMHWMDELSDRDQPQPNQITFLNSDRPSPVVLYADQRSVLDVNLLAIIVSWPIAKLRHRNG